MARQWRVNERPFRRQSFKAIQTLAQGVGLHGVNFRIRYGGSKERPLLVDGFIQGLSAFQACAVDARLIYLPIRESLLSVRCFALWLGSLIALVYAADGSVRHGTAPQGLPSPLIPRRLSFSTVSCRGGVLITPLPAGIPIPGRSFRQAGLASPSQQRPIGRYHENRASRGARRHCCNEVLHSPKETNEGTGTSQES